MSTGLARIFPELDADELQRLLAWVDALTEGVDPGREPFVVPSSGADPAWTRVAHHGDAERGMIFGEVVTPLIADLLDDAAAALNAHPLVEGDRVSLRVRSHVLRQTTTLGARHLLRRLDGARAAGTLLGDTPEDRFAHFIDLTGSRPGVAALVADLPDLVAWLRHVTRLRLAAIVDAFDDTAREWPRIAATIPQVRADDRIVDLDPGAGDTHGGGAAVAILHLDSGARLVTKPRSLAVEQGFAAFTAWFGERVGAELPAPASHTTDRRGWVEFITPSGTHAEGYLRSSGALLAALHLLRATDMHYENLVSNHDGLPVVIDAETLFTPVVEGTDRPRDGLLGVVSTGLLSLRRETAGELDPGAFGYRPGAQSPYSSWRAVHPGRDDMRLEMVPVQVDHESPVPAGVSRGPDGVAAMTGGFADAMSWVLGNRDEVADAIEGCFPDGAVRYIHRPTMSYAQVLRMSTHPAFASRRDRHRALARIAVLLPRAPEPLLASEVLQLTDGDLPSFSVPLRGTTVRDGRGIDIGARVVGAPLERCVQAIRELTGEAVETEVDVVRGSLSAW